MAAPKRHQWDLNNPPFYAGGSVNRPKPIFMPASDIVATHRAGDLSAPTKAEQDAKGDELGGTAWHIRSNTGAGYAHLAKSIREKGFDTNKPILVNPEHSSPSKPEVEPTILDGHHRVHAALTVDPELPVPVMYTRMSTEMRHPKAISNDLYKPSVDKDGLSKIRTNEQYAGRCRACGQPVEKGAGSMVRIPSYFDRSKGNYHVYHPEHLNEVTHSMYEHKKSGLGIVGRNRFRNWVAEQEYQESKNSEVE
jgi:hypothetical protein